MHPFPSETWVPVSFFLSLSLFQFFPENIKQSQVPLSEKVKEQCICGANFFKTRCVCVCVCVCVFVHAHRIKILVKMFACEKVDKRTDDEQNISHYIFTILKFYFVGIY